MFEWWTDLSKPAQYGIAVLFLLISTGLFFSGWFWPWGWAIGGVLLGAAVLTD